MTPTLVVKLTLGKTVFEISINAEALHSPSPMVVFGIPQEQFFI
jgi:hypothetical protein